ncbi:MAG: M23 family metallopeptidase [Thermoanaerobaculales bacterium]|jgi:murein DD-endopeptidase MepM/ murein hydrolase activator NlpD|nr:M23 family metallopeptidase [Thermoanaerobaculales bacterium]
MTRATAHLTAAGLALALAACASGGRPQPTSVPTGWPVAPSAASVSAAFGAVRGGTRHQGIDLAAPAGTPVWATADGTVVAAGRDGRFGRTVVVDHGGGYRTRYAHLKKIETRVGRRVRRGDVLGRVGRSGNARGAHLHYEVLRDGVAVDPRPFMG